MTISEAIKALEQLRELHGEVEVLTDCSFCGQSTAPTMVVAQPVKVKLIQQRKD